MSHSDATEQRQSKWFYCFNRSSMVYKCYFYSKMTMLKPLTLSSVRNDHRISTKQVFFIVYQCPGDRDTVDFQMPGSRDSSYNKCLGFPRGMLSAGIDSRITLTLYWESTTDLTMTTTQVFETSVSTNNGPSQNYTNPDDQPATNIDSPGSQPTTVLRTTCMHQLG